MARQTARPRSNTERGRASRYRSRAAAGELGKRDTAWLAKYDRTVTDAAQLRSERRAAVQEFAQANPNPGAASNTDRGKASRYNATGWANLSQEQRRWLESYQEARETARRWRGRQRAERRTPRSAQQDADELALALAGWLGGAGELRPTEAGRRSGAASVEASVADPEARWPDGDWVRPDASPHLAGALSRGHAMSVRVLLQTGTTSRWTTVLAYTDNAVLAEDDIAESIDEAADGYAADGIAAVAVIVGPA